MKWNQMAGYVGRQAAAQENNKYDLRGKSKKMQAKSSVGSSDLRRVDSASMRMCMRCGG